MKILWVVTFIISLSWSPGMPLLTFIKGSIYVNLGTKFQNNCDLSLYIFFCVPSQSPLHYYDVSSSYSFISDWMEPSLLVIGCIPGNLSNCLKSSCFNSPLSPHFPLYALAIPSHFVLELFILWSWLKNCFLSVFSCRPLSHTFALSLSMLPTAVVSVTSFIWFLPKPRSPFQNFSWTVTIFHCLCSMYILWKPQPSIPKLNSSFDIIYPSSIVPTLCEH